MSRQVKALVALWMLAAGLAMAAATPAWAHLPAVPPAERETTQPPVPVVEVVADASSAGDAEGPSSKDRLPLETALVLAIALAAGVAARRRGLVTGLGLLVAMLAVEGSVHSVHHVGDAEAAADCVVAVVSAQVSGTLAEPSAVDDPCLAIPVGTVQALAAVHPDARPRSPDAGRAPPAA
jgi:hypothetical protein